MIVLDERVVVRHKTEVQPPETVTPSVCVQKSVNEEYSEAVARHETKINELIKKSREKWYCETKG